MVYTVPCPLTRLREVYHLTGGNVKTERSENMSKGAMIMTGESAGEVAKLSNRQLAARIRKHNASAFMAFTCDEIYMEAARRLAKIK